MGWKALRDLVASGVPVDPASFRVSVEDGQFVFGAGWIGRVLLVTQTGRVQREYEASSDSVWWSIERFLRDHPERVREAIEQVDTFSVSLPVYSYQGAQIVESRCEAYGWPNCTHEGDLMHENTFSQDRSEVVEWGFRNARAGVLNSLSEICKLERQLATARARLEGYQSAAAELLEAERDVLAGRGLDIGMCATPGCGKPIDLLERQGLLCFDCEMAAIARRQEGKAVE